MERYEEWDVTIPPLPSRSRLYRLEPIGIGTPYVESLTGYIARLAEAHCVFPKAIVMQEILPFQGIMNITEKHYYRLNSFWRGNALTLNGVSLIAEQWVEAVQALTTYENLRFTTMLTWSEVIASGGLIRQGKAWCPQCYETWRQAKQPIYEPLLWALQLVEICPIHLKPLTTHCSHCRKTLPFLTQFARPGYCSQCVRWLGRNFISHKGESTCLEVDPFSWQRWVLESVGALLSAAPSIVIKPTKEQIAEMMNVYLVEYARGNISAFARLLKMSIPTLWCYLQKTKMPQFDSLLHLCFGLSISPLEFLTARTALSQSIVRLAPAPLPTVSRDKRQRIMADDVHRMRQSLETLLAKKMALPPSLEAIAQQIGYSVGTLYKHCPELCRAIVTQRKLRFIEEQVGPRIKQALEEAAASDKRLSLAEVARQINCDCSILRRYFSELCQTIYKRYRERMKSIDIHQQLLAVLSNEGEVPCIEELAIRWGYKRVTLEYNFPDLCKQIAARLRMQRKMQHEERLNIIHAQIRQMMLTLYQQGIFPSSRQVAKRLNNPNLLRRKTEHEVWCKMLEELGYPISGNEESYD